MKLKLETGSEELYSISTYLLRLKVEKLPNEVGVLSNQL